MCDDYHKSLIRDMAKVEYQATLDLDYTLVVEYFHFNIKPSVNFSNRVHRDLSFVNILLYFSTQRKNISSGPILKGHTHSTWSVYKEPRGIKLIRASKP